VTDSKLPNHVLTVHLAEDGAVKDEQKARIDVQVISFGYLHGTPPDAHLVLDVRQYLRDPAAARNLLDLDGRDPRVAAAVMATPGAAASSATLTEFAAGFPHAHCVLAVGCAGGRHRSVALAEQVAGQLRRRGHAVTVEHRHVHLPRVVAGGTGPVIRTGQPARPIRPVHPSRCSTADLPQRLTVFAALAAVFTGSHGLLDQWIQTGWAAAHKRAHGAHPVDRQGTPLAAGQPARLTATGLGRRAATQHVLHYTAGQTVAAAAIVRALGFRMPLRALVAGALINGVTHWVIDRHRPLRAAARLAGKSAYLQSGTVVRQHGAPADAFGPGTAHFELDQSAHEAIGLLAAAVMAVLAVPPRRGTNR
jgi:hypothetical protein